MLITEHARLAADQCYQSSIVMVQLVGWRFTVQ